MPSIDQLAYNFMSSSQMFQQYIQVLRSRDKVKDLANHLNSQIHPLSNQDTLLHLLEVADQLECSNELKFFWRAFYIWLVGKSQDGISTEELPCYMQSSLYRAYQLSANSEEFDAFCSNQSSPEMFSYFQSQKHQQLLEKLNQLTNEQLSLSSPYLFLKATKPQLTSQHFEQTIGYLIDLALAIPMSLLCTSEEVFVACSLVLLEKGKIAGLQEILVEHFYDSLEKGHQLMAAIAQQLQQTLANEV